MDQTISNLLSTEFNITLTIKQVDREELICSNIYLAEMIKKNTNKIIENNIQLSNQLIESNKQLAKSNENNQEIMACLTGIVALASVLQVIAAFL